MESLICSVGAHEHYFPLVTVVILLPLEGQLLHPVIYSGLVAHFFHSALRTFQTMSGPGFSRLFEMFSVRAHIHISSACDGDRYILPAQGNFHFRRSLLPCCPCFTVFTLFRTTSVSEFYRLEETCITQTLLPPFYDFGQAVLFLQSCCPCFTWFYMVSYSVSLTKPHKFISSATPQKFSQPL